MRTKIKLIIIASFLIIAPQLLSAQLSYDWSNVEIIKCFEQIESSSNYNFVYNPQNNSLRTKVSLKIENKPIEFVLEQLLQGTKLKYKLFDNSTIAIQSSTQNANDKIVTGRVVNNQNGAIGQAIIFEKNNPNNKVVANENGYFTIVLKNTGSIIVRNSGYLDQEIPYSNDFVLVKLVPTTQNLDEVVVVGYGTQKITKVSGAISVVKGSDIEKINAVRTEEALQGRATGVNVINSGVPGAKPTVLIRGIPSFSGADPLIVVDGNQQTLDDLNSIAASDIESISVLKDAASSAIYGVRGGNGVIVITTKSGRKNQKTLFNINTNSGWQELIRKVPVLTGSQYAAIINEGSVTSGGNIIFPNISNIASTNWQDQIFKPAPLLNYSISAQGGSDKVNYFLAINYLNQGGIVGGIDKSNFQRTNFTANVQFDLSKKLRFIVNTTGILLNSKGGYFEQGFNSVIGAALNFDPTVPIYNQNPNVASTYGYSTNILSEIHNPLTQLDNIYNQNDGFKLYGKLELQYQVIKPLKLISRFGYTKYDDNTKNFTPLIFWGVNNVDNTLQADGLTPVTDRHNSVQSVKTSNFNFIFENFAQFNYVVREAHNIEAIAGMTIAKTSGNAAGATRQDVPFNSWTLADFTAATGQNTAENSQGISGYYYQYEKRNLSFFGRIQYDYEGRYLASFSIRQDGSTSFGTENKFGTFPALSLGWAISNEKFFDKVKNIQNLKLRASYGVTGNDNAINPTSPIIVQGGPSYAQYPPNSNGYTFGNIFYPGSTIGIIANNALRWEQNIQANIGIDISFLKYFTIQADVFQKNVDGLLFTPSASLYLGTVPKPSQNIGNTESKGFEFNFQFSKEITKKLSIQTSINYTMVNSLVTATNQDGTARIVGGGFFNGQSQYVTVFEKGQAPGYFYGWKAVGVFQNQADIENSATQVGAQLGDIKFADVNGDGVINDQDRTNIGNPFPLFTLGWNFSINFYNFDFTSFIYASVGNSVYRAYERNANYTNKFAGILDRWTGPNTTNNPTDPRYSFSDPNSNIRVSSRYVEDGSFIKIKNLQLGYNLRINKGVKVIRFYLQVKNAFTFTRYSGFDPEISGGILESGIDRGSYPQTRVYSFGLDIKL